MLYAYDQEKQLRSADTVEMKDNRFHCPGCQEQVTWKRGPKRRAHFAHRKNAECSTFSEGETEEHLAAKAYLYDWFDPLPVKIECFLPELTQRPDLKYQQLVIEVQCSPISLTDFSARTAGYLKAGYQPWWILGLRLQPKKIWHTIAKASCMYDDQGFNLWGIDVGRQCLIQYTAIDWHYQYGVGYQCTWFSEDCSFDKETLRPINTAQTKPHTVRRLWQPNAYQFWLLQQLIKKTPRIMQVQALVYSLNRHIAQLPFWCYQDSRFGFLFEHWVLVMRVCFDLDPQQSFAQWLHKLRMIDWSWPYPLIDQSTILCAFFEECQQLEARFHFQNE
ncbi:competence protein CoiA [Enterococcus sp. N342-3-1-2]